MITIKTKNKVDKTEEYFKKLRNQAELKNAEYIGEECVKALRQVTPKRTGLTAESWRYEIQRSNSGTTIQLLNTNIQNGENVALLIEFGHATPSGRWIAGTKYIEPAIQEAYMNAVKEKWKELNKL